ncbi:hypothetical protein JW756_01765 [Candidatus Woesearchaeota archaeon]|nr:hypothetical protein [Candidatus Woesearchaeota archaeon]
MKNSGSSLIILVVKDVLAKKELKNLDEDFVRLKVQDYLKRYPKAKEKLERVKYPEFQRSKEHDEMIRKIRSELREVYGVFIQEDYNKRFGLLDELKKNPSLENLEIHNKILMLHKSSQERLQYYSVIYKKIFKITGLPKKIVDFACGLNPFSYPYVASAGCKPEYVACDLAEKDLDFIKKYFEIMKIKGFVKKIDLTKADSNEINKITHNADAVFLFKTLDSLEAVGWGMSEKLIKSIKAKFIIVSFSSKSIGGKKTIKKEKRAWFERLANVLSYKIQGFEIPGEIFYILSL